LVVECDSGSIDEVGLLHLYNAIGQAGGSLLLTGTEAPARWPVSLPDLRSRLRAITSVGIGQPDDELLAAVLAKLFGDRQLAVPPEVISFMLSRLERSLDAARQSVVELDAYALEKGRPITVRLAAEVLNG
jgi:chromosomal replication initiation ATPase DnaA